MKFSAGLSLSLVALVSINSLADNQFRFKVLADVTKISQSVADDLSSKDAYDQRLGANIRFIHKYQRSRLTIEADVVGNVDWRILAHNQFAIPTETPELNRILNLSTVLSSSRHHSASVGIDRLKLTYGIGNWRVQLGRLPVSWGRGIVYHPLDVFSSFAPTLIDREFKPSNDSILVERLLESGVEFQLLGIARKVERIGLNKSSTIAFKAYIPIGANEIDLAFGRHFDEQIVGMSFAVQVGDFLVRNDIAATCHDGKCKVSGVLNADYSFSMGGRIFYSFIEYYHNGFGASNLSNGISGLTSRHRLGLQRGEVFAYGKNLLATGCTIAWHPLWSQAVSLLTSLDDQSSLLQTYLNVEPTDNLSLAGGIRIPRATDNQEFGPVQSVGSTTIGGDPGLFFEMVYYH